MTGGHGSIHQVLIGVAAALWAVLAAGAAVEIVTGSHWPSGGTGRLVLGAAVAVTERIWPWRPASAPAPGPPDPMSEDELMDLAFWSRQRLQSEYRGRWRLEVERSQKAA